MLMDWRPLAMLLHVGFVLTTSLAGIDCYYQFLKKLTRILKWCRNPRDPLHLKQSWQKQKNELGDLTLLNFETCRPQAGDKSWRWHSLRQGEQWKTMRAQSSAPACLVSGFAGQLNGGGSILFNNDDEDNCMSTRNTLKLGHFITPYTNVSKWLTDSRGKVRQKKKKEGKLIYLYDHGSGKFYLDTISRTHTEK